MIKWSDAVKPEPPSGSIVLSLAPSAPNVPLLGRYCSTRTPKLYRIVRRAWYIIQTVIDPLIHMDWITYSTVLGRRRKRQLSDKMLTEFIATIPIYSLRLLPVKPGSAF